MLFKLVKLRNLIQEKIGTQGNIWNANLIFKAFILTQGEFKYSKDGATKCLAPECQGNWGPSNRVPSNRVPSHSNLSLGWLNSLIPGPMELKKRNLVLKKINKFPLTPRGVLTTRSVHARPSARPQPLE